MLRKMLYLIPVLLLVGTGCIIGNKEGGKDTAPAVQEMGRSGDEVVPVGASPIVPPMAELSQDAQAELLMDMTPASVPAPGSNPQPAPTPVTAENPLPTLTVNMKSGNFFFDPPLISAKPGQKVEIHIASNQGLHTFVIDQLAVHAQITDGAVISFTVPQKNGDYAYYCDIGSHRQLGMEGVLRVE